MWDGLRQDIVFGVRMLRRQPGFTVVALMALALGIGANTAIFSIVDAVLWRPLPYPASEAIVSLGEQRPRERPPARAGRARPTSTTGAATAESSPRWRRRSSPRLNITGSGEPERLRGHRCLAGFLDVLGITPARGRDFPRRGRRRPAVTASSC